MLFRQADQGDLSAVDELCSILPHVDAQVACEAPQRTNGVAQLDEQLQPASSAPIDNEICDFIRQQLLDHPQWSDVKAALNHNWLPGLAAVEILWDKRSQKIAGFQRLPLRRLTYTAPDGLLLDEPLLLTDEQPMGIPFDPRAIVLATRNSLIDHPVRLGAYRAIALGVMCKQYSIQDWSAFLERYGIPTIWGKYDAASSPQDIENLFAAVRSLISDSRLVTSNTADIQLLDSQSGTGSNGSSFAEHCQYWDAAISKVIKGQALNSAIGPKGGSETDAKTLSAGFISDTVAPDGMRLAGIIREQLIRPLVQLHFGPAAALPLYSLVPRSSENFEANIKCMEAAQAAKLPVTLMDAYARLGFQQPEIDSELVQWPDDRQSAVHTVANKLHAAKYLPVERQAEQAQDELDQLAAQAAAGGEKDFVSNASKVVSAVRSAESYADALTAIQNAASGLSGASIETSLRRGVMEAMLRGMQQVQEQVKQLKK